jgi:hypothetical protein
MLAVTAAASALLGAAAGCSLLGGTAKTAATRARGAASSSTAPSSYSPLAGPTEAAAALPKECSKILGTAQLQAVFGAGLPIGEDYGSYAALPSIGRTGRVVCVFGVGLDSFGRQSAGSVEVAIATYTTASGAVGRAADTVRSDAQAGDTTAAVSVGGHPATIVVEQGAAGTSASSAASASPSVGASASTSPVLPSSASPAVPSPALPSSASPAVPSPSPSLTAGAGGETELVMADGNRTFVLQIPFAKLSAQQAAGALTRLALEAYQNTLPAAAASARPSPSTR